MTNTTAREGEPARAPPWFPAPHGVPPTRALPFPFTGKELGLSGPVAQTAETRVGIGVHGGCPRLAAPVPACSPSRALRRCRGRCGPRRRCFFSGVAESLLCIGIAETGGINTNYFIGLKFIQIIWSVYF